MPFLLVGLLGVSIPIIIHLLHRQRTQPVLWGAMQFLRTSPLQMKRKKKVDHWLLMAIRILALAVLAFLLARPRMMQSKYVPKGLTDSPVDVAVVLDHSLSTGRLSNGQTVFDRSVAVTDKMLEQLKPADTMTVILAEHKARPLNIQPIKKSDGNGVQQLHQRLAQEKQGMTDCSIPEAVSAARRVLANGRNANKLVIVVSDDQRANWHIKDDALWRAALGDRNQAVARNLTIHSFPIHADADMSNVSVSSINVTPTILGVNRPVQINATVTNTGTGTMSGLFARLIVNNKELDTKPVSSLAAKTSATIRFDLDTGLTQAGSNWVKVAVNAVDALQADNEAVAAANVLARIPVLVIDGQYSDAGTFKSSQFLQAALQPQDNSLVQAKVVSVSDAVSAKLDDYMVVVLNDVPQIPQSLRDRLADYARTGHGLWIILGQRTQKPLIEKELANSGFLSAKVRDLVSMPDAPSGVEVKDPTNPMIRVVTANERNALTGTATRKWWGLTASDAQTVLAASNGDPLILERPFGTNGGIVTVWTSSVDGAWNNWNLIPNFVPLVNETVYHLSTAQLHGLENHGIEAGQPIEWAGPAKPAVQSVQITLPDNTSVTRPATFNNGRWLVTYPDTYLPGIYKLQFTPTEVQPVYYGVNIDHTELDPTNLDPDDMNWLKNGSYLDPSLPTIAESDLPMIIRRESQGRELWGYLGGVLLASLIIETFLTYRLIGSQKRVDVAGAGLPTAHVAA
ncbi:MAG TPA: BatA domain-containing protein [Tepidisphaeraceae bacterium]|nr:BatA domain-containing protein [Tepidisphaeraceae bacterium]